MSLNLLHRLKFSIRDDVLLLLASLFLLQCVVASRQENASLVAVTPSSSSSSVETAVKVRPTTPTHQFSRDKTTLNMRKRNVDDRQQRRLSSSVNLWHDTFLFDIHDEDDVARNRPNENVRWRKINAIGERLVRRKKRNLPNVLTTIDKQNAIVNASNSTKIVNFSNRNLSDVTELSDFIDTGNTSNLFSLDLSQNKLKQIPLNAFENVTELNLANNRIEAFPFGGNENDMNVQLQQLNLSMNFMRKFSGNGAKKLKRIDLSCNQFSHAEQLNFSQLNDLEYIDLSCNRIDALNVETLQNSSRLRLVNLAGNRLRTIQKEHFYNLLDIDILILSQNDISHIEIDAFVYLPNLQYLDLSFNRLNAMSIPSLQAIPDLTSLSVAYNYELGDALQGFITSWSLKELDASGTGLCQIPAALAQSVHTLNISNNHFDVSYIFCI